MALFCGVNYAHYEESVNIAKITHTSSNLTCRLQIGIPLIDLTKECWILCYKFYDVQIHVYTGTPVHVFYNQSKSKNMDQSIYIVWYKEAYSGCFMQHQSPSIVSLVIVIRKLTTSKNYFLSDSDLDI